MEIQKIEIGNEGYIHCHSRFYSSQDCLSSNAKFSFVTGINRLYGEIDSSIWAISYLLSMYSYRQADFILFKQPEVVIDGKKMLLDDAMKYSCYMDNIYPLFSSDVPIKKIVTDRLNETESKFSADDIKDMFCIDNQRFERPVSNTGNEFFKAMSAIGYCYGKEIFCFPWLSQQRFENYHKNLSSLLETLKELNKIVILPTGK